MKKYAVWGGILLLLLTGCNNEVAINSDRETSKEKNDYLVYKNELK